MSGSDEEKAAVQKWKEHDALDRLKNKVLQPGGKWQVPAGVAEADIV